MHNFNFLRMGNPSTFDYSKRQVVRNTRNLTLPTYTKPNHLMDELRVRNFVTNAPRPRQVPTIDMIEQERLLKYGQRIDIDPQAFAEKLMKMTLKLPVMDESGMPIKDQTGRMVYKYYTYKDVLASPFLKRFRISQLRTGYGKGIMGEVYGDDELPTDVATEISMLSGYHTRVKKRSEKKSEPAGVYNDEQNELAKKVANNMIDTADAETLARIVDEGNKGGDADLEIALHMFNPNDETGAAAFKYVSDEVGNSSFNTAEEALSAWIAFVGAKYGIRPFNLYEALDEFKNGPPQSWLARRKRIIEGIVLHYSDKAALEFAGMIEGGNSLRFKLNDFNPPQTSPESIYLMRLCASNNHVPMNIVIRSFLFFIERKYGNDSFDSNEAMKAFNESGGIEVWDKELGDAKRGRMETLERID